MKPDLDTSKYEISDERMLRITRDVDKAILDGHAAHLCQIAYGDFAWLLEGRHKLERAAEQAADNLEETERLLACARAEVTGARADVASLQLDNAALRRTILLLARG